MNYGECRDKALQLINQYTLAGAKIAPTYNNQQDYINRIPGLINDAELLLASGPKRLKNSIYLDPSVADHDAHMYRYILPEDLMDIVPHGLLVITDGHTYYESGYTRMGDTYILVPDHIRGDVYLEYYRRPQLLPANPADTHPLDNVAAAQTAIPYYVAAFLVIEDDAYRYTALYNEWQMKLSMLGEETRAQREVVHDVYNFAGVGDYC